MISVQAISKILDTKDFEFIQKSNITAEYFIGYEKEFDFIKNHYNKYGNVPDKETFIEKFPNFTFTETKESYEYITNKLKEGHLFNEFVPILQKAADMSELDTNAAVEYIRGQLKSLSTGKTSAGIDIIHDTSRLDEYNQKSTSNKDNWFFKSGFDELDTLTHGIQRGEELIILFARTNHGKTWVAEKMAVSVVEQGFNVGFYSPEMTATSIGYRFDTLHRNFENSDLVTGAKNDDAVAYTRYIKKELPKYKAKFLVSNPKDFDGRPTVSAIRSWIIENDLHMAVIDGLSYITDERGKRSDNKTTTLTNISEDLMNLSVELKVPIIAVVQANREAAGDDRTSGPSIENIRDSDGIAYNASKILSLRLHKGILEFNILKQRNGQVGNKIKYNWDINRGQFTYIPDAHDGVSTKSTADNQAALFDSDSGSLDDALFM